MPAGRPTKYDPAYCDAVVEHMAEGASLTSFAASIGVCRDTISEWAVKHQEFSAAVKAGKAKCAAWWEGLARSNAVSGEGNATLCIFGLKNMAAEDWREKSLIGSDPENPLPASFSVNLVRPSKND
jgi:hypothetical protein